MKKPHTLPSNEVIDTHAFLDNWPQSWVLGFVGTPESKNLWADVHYSEKLYSQASAKVWNVITYRFKDMASAAVYSAINYSHDLIYKKADERDRPLLLYKLYWHVKNSELQAKAKTE